MDSIDVIAHRSRGPCQVSLTFFRAILAGKFLVDGDVGYGADKLGSWCLFKFWHVVGAPHNSLAQDGLSGCLIKIDYGVR